MDRAGVRDADVDGIAAGDVQRTASGKSRQRRGNGDRSSEQGDVVDTKSLGRDIPNRTVSPPVCVRLALIVSVSAASALAIAVMPPK